MRKTVDENDNDDYDTDTDIDNFLDIFGDFARFNHNSSPVLTNEKTKFISSPQILNLKPVGNIPMFKASEGEAPLKRCLKRRKCL